MGRMLWEAQNKKGRAMGAKPSFILPELVRCQMQTNMACPPLACSSPASHGAWPVSAELLIVLEVTRSPSTAFRLV